MGLFAGKFVYLLEMGGITLYACLIKDKLIDLIKRAFNREGSTYLASNDRNAFFTSKKPKHIMSCQNVCDALVFLFDNI